MAMDRKEKKLKKQREKKHFRQAMDRDIWHSGMKT